MIAYASNSEGHREIRSSAKSRESRTINGANSVFPRRFVPSVEGQQVGLLRSGLIQPGFY